LGLSYFLSIATIYVRDIQPFWGIFSHSLLFISPVFWKLENVNGTVLTQIHSINPLGQIIELTHHFAIYGDLPPLNDFVYTALIVLGILFTGYAIFNRLESKIMERI
jgi:ABC-type polysaccharide/polyol phosphate export permease